VVSRPRPFGQARKPTPRETILAALHARLSALPATALSGDVLPEGVSAASLLIPRDGEPEVPQLVSDD
jgi:hypothetical protein